MLLPHSGVLPFGHVFAQKGNQRGLRLGFADGRSLDLVDETAFAMRALVPGIHAAKQFVRLMNGEYRAFDANLQIGLLTTTAISIMRSRSGFSPVISQSSHTILRSDLGRTGGVAATGAALTEFVQEASDMAQIVAYTANTWLPD